MRVSVSIRLLFVVGIISLLLFGCKSTKTNTTKTVSTATDTVRIKEVIYVKDSSHTTPPINTHIELPNPCDSLGQLLKYYQTIKVGNDSITVDTRSGKLVINTNKQGTNSRQLSNNSSKDINQKTSRENQSATVDKEVIVQTKYPWWLVVYAIVMTIVAAVLAYAFFSTLFIRLK